MDGNGRWAAQRGWTRIKGHKMGVQAVDEVLEEAARVGIRHLSLYAFSTENWKRPAAEVSALMAMLRMYLRAFMPKLMANGIRFHHIGDKEGLPAGVAADIATLEARTAHLDRMTFHLAVNYGSRLEILHAARKCLAEGLAAADLDEAAFQQRLWTGAAPDVDLLIRTSGELRISNFLLWQAAYAEFYVTETLWPDFRAGGLREALEAYAQRERRFGGL
ncbi:MAG: di-trans,poly-cis-decaprenylcistransferase [Holophagaceae bacterium]|nr:di-trans,poly-cis-decaprenylcistransferase [Holophagaceae bacterium]